MNNAAAANTGAQVHEIEQVAATMDRTSAANAVDQRYFIVVPLEHRGPRRTGSQGYGHGVSAGFSSTDIRWKATGSNHV